MSAYGYPEFADEIAAALAELDYADDEAIAAARRYITIGQRADREAGSLKARESHGRRGVGDGGCPTG